MYYKYDFTKLHNYVKKTDEQVTDWLELLDSINKAMQSIISTSKISGSGADNIKSYFTVAHGLIYGNLMEILRMHVGNAKVYEEDYRSIVSSDTKTHVETKETESISKKVEKQRDTVDKLTEEINNTIGSIKDLVALKKVKAGDIQEARSKVEKFIKVLNELIDKIEQDHSKNDFTITAQSIQRTKTLIVSMQNSRNYLADFDKNAFYSTKEFRDFYESAVQVDNSYNANIESYKSAAEGHQATEEVYIAERERQAEMIKLAVVVVTTAVGVAVSVATAGVASPLVAAGITAMVSAGSAAASSMVDSALDVYVMDGDLDNLDVDQALRDAGKAAVIAGATSLVGSAVSSGVQTGMTNAISSHSIKTVGDAGLYGLANSSAGRIGAGVAIGATSKIVEGVTTRAVSTFADDMVEWDETGVHWSDDNTLKDGFEHSMKKAFDPKEMGKDAVYGGVSGGIKEQKNIRKEKYESTVTKQENLKQEASGEDLEYVDTPKPKKGKTSNAYKTNSKSEREIIQDMHDSGEWDDISDYDEVPTRKQSAMTKEMVGKDEGWKKMRYAKDSGKLNKKYKNYETGVKTTTKISGKIGAESEKDDDQNKESMFDYKGKKMVLQ